MFSLKNWQQDKHWQNWVGYVKATPAQKLTPSTIDELCAIVKEANKTGKHIRVTGAAHSFSPVAQPEEIAISLHHLRGLVSIDAAAREVTLWAGTYLYEIGDMLAQHGFALENMGDIQFQSLAGAVATGTHGTGISLGSVSSQVVAWEWVDGTGQLHHHRRGEDELSQALTVSLGLLGIFTKLTLKVVPLYGLKEQSCTMSFADGLASFDQDVKNHRHMEWFLFPDTNKLQKKTLTPTTPAAMSQWQKVKDRFESVIVLNGAFYLMSELARKHPKFIRTVSKLSADNIPNTVRQGLSYEVFPKPRGVVFDESEYFIRYEDFPKAITAINDALLDDTKGSHFPIEVRTIKGEAGFLSPTQGCDCVVLSFHVYRGIDSRPYFDWVKTFMQPWSGRPHWGKVLKLDHHELAKLYPDLPKFMAIRAQYDPNGVFLNTWLHQKFIG